MHGGNGLQALGRWGVGIAVRNFFYFFSSTNDSNPSPTQPTNILYTSVHPWAIQLIRPHPIQHFSFSLCSLPAEARRPTRPSNGPSSNSSRTRPTRLRKPSAVSPQPMTDRCAVTAVKTKSPALAAASPASPLLLAERFVMTKLYAESITKMLLLFAGERCCASSVPRNTRIGAFHTTGSLESGHTTSPAPRNDLYNPLV